MADSIEDHVIHIHFCSGYNLLLLTNGTFVGDTEKIEWGSKNVSLVKTIAIAA